LPGVSTRRGRLGLDNNPAERSLRDGRHWPQETICLPDPMPARRGFFLAVVTPNLAVVRTEILSNLSGAMILRITIQSLESQSPRNVQRP
jgi:hypothetical protein